MKIRAKKEWKAVIIIVLIRFFTRFSKGILPVCGLWYMISELFIFQKNY
ncbi:MAG: hypothetical protein J6U04_06175 [Salinivirgaceae bacterium]|nr:hypothetical protein [Salinivirgaceae bacterium]